MSTAPTEPPGPLAAPAPAAGQRPSDWVRRSRLKLTRKRIALLCLAVLVFLALSFLLARYLQVENVERDDDLELVEAETKGQTQRMLDLLDGCRSSASCAATVRADASDPRVLRSGAVKILELQSETAYSLTGSTGETRLAWTVIGKLPVVQCIDVRRSGNFLSGIDVSLLRISAPIDNEADC